MLLVAPVTKTKWTTEAPISIENKTEIEHINELRSSVPSITHVDYSARIQTVSKKDNPLYYNLIKSFYEKTGVPLIINTSFNVRGEPIVCSPADAIRCFLGTELDTLVIGDFFVEKDQQDGLDIQRYEQNFELD